METKKGQSLIEVVFSIAVVVLVITGVVTLITNTVSVETNAFQRKMASDMAEVVVENLVQKQKNDTNNFWLLQNITTPQTLTGFTGYTYTVEYTKKTDGGCSDCADVKITILWGSGKSLVVNRFFSRSN